MRAGYLFLSFIFLLGVVAVGFCIWLGSVDPREHVEFIRRAPFLFLAAALVVGGFFELWMLLDCLTKESSQGNTKIVWLLFMLFFQGLGAILYFFIRRPRRIAELGR